MQQQVELKTETPRNNPELAIESYELAVAHYSKREFREAGEAFDKFLKSAQNNDPTLTANAQFFRARTHMFLGENEAAQKLFEAFGANKDFQSYTNLQREAQFRRAEIFISQSKWLEAEKLLTTLSKDPNLDKIPYGPWVNVLLGRSYLEQGKLEAAITEFTKLESDKHSNEIRLEAYAQHIICTARLQPTNWENCEKLLAELEKISSNSTTTRETLLSLASAAEKSDNHLKAKIFYQKASELFLNSYEGTNYDKQLGQYCAICATLQSAKTLLTQGKNHEALELYTKCISETKLLTGGDAQVNEAVKSRLLSAFEQGLLLCTSEKQASTLYDSIIKSNPNLEVGASLQTAGIQHYNTWLSSADKNEFGKLAYYLIKTAITSFPEIRANESAGENVRYAGCVLALDCKDKAFLSELAADFEKRFPKSANLAYIQMLGSQAETSDEKAILKLNSAIEGLAKDEKLKSHLPYAEYLLAERHLAQAITISSDMTKQEQAVKLLEQIHQNHARTEIGGRALLHKGKILESMGKVDEAKAVFTLITNVYEEYPELTKQAYLKN